MSQKSKDAPVFAGANPPSAHSGMQGVEGEDLSARICAAVDREPGDIVRCTRVGQHAYRCNWWHSLFVSALDNPGMKGGQLGTTYRVRKSSFYEVRQQDGKLDLNERPARSPRAGFIR
jgi:hypothetical protein